jgi:hypothetical protein
VTVDCGFRVVYGYTQSDEISLLFHRDEDAFGRKFDSILAGEASAKFSLLLGAHAAFDCRLCELPNADLVRDYFAGAVRTPTATRSTGTATGPCAARGAARLLSSRLPCRVKRACAPAVGAAV